MHGRIAPPLVEKAARSIQVVEIILVPLAPPELHIRDLEIAPEMTGRVPISDLVMLGPSVFIRQPIHGVFLVKMVRVRRHELLRFRPEGAHALGCIEQVDGEAVGFVVLFHVAEDVVVDVAEEVDFWFDAPVPSCVC